MSNSKLAVEKIKGLMKEFGFISEEKELMSFSIEDGNNTILQVEKLEVGNKVLKINEEFAQVALEDGSYKLKENFEIEVKNGSILTVREIFVEAELEDGTKVSIEGDEVAVGAKVMVITEQGSVPAPDGTHSVKDGSKITTKGGVIEAVEMSEEEDAAGENVEGVEKPMGGTEVEIEKEDMGVEADEIIAILKEFVKALEAKYASVQSEVEAVKAELAAFRKEPAGKPVPMGKADFSSNKDENSVDARVKALMAMK